MRRANARVTEREPRFEISSAVRDRTARSFFSALEYGDLDTLVGVLAADVVAYGDGGGVGPSLWRPVHGRNRVLGLLRALSETLRRADLHIEPCPVNGQPGATVQDRHGSLFNVMSIDVADGQVQTVRSIINPDKLRHLGPLLDPLALRSPPSTDRE